MQEGAWMSRMNVHSRYSRYPEWVANVLNGRSFMTKSGHGPDVLNVQNGRPFVILRTLLGERDS